MAEGRRIARKYNKKGSAVGNLLNPVRGIRDRQARSGQIPRNHAQDNIRALRQKQAQNRALREQKQNEADDRFVMKRFRDVKSRWVKPDVAERDRKKSEYLKQRAQQMKERQEAEEVERIQAAAARAAENARLASENLARAEEEEAAARARRTARRRKTPSKPRVPKRNEVQKLAPRSKKDFIRSNAAAAITSSPPKAEAEPTSPTRRDGYGEVPQYIQERKAEMAEAARQRQEQEQREEGCPPGMTRMDNAERLETLSVLKKNQRLANQQLAKLPLTIETPSMRRRKDELERKLQQIEEAIKIFSRDVVFIKDD